MRAVVFGQAQRRNTGADDWGVDRVRNIDPHSGKSNVSQIHNLFDDDHAGKLMDGRGDGKGYKLAGGLPRGLANKPSAGGVKSLVPTSAMLGANVNSNWAKDRDQRLDYASDPAVLAQAAEMGEELARVTSPPLNTPWHRPSLPPRGIGRPHHPALAFFGRCAA